MLLLLLSWGRFPFIHIFCIRITRVARAIVVVIVVIVIVIVGWNVVGGTTLCRGGGLRNGIAEMFLEPSNQLLWVVERISSEFETLRGNSDGFVFDTRCKITQSKRSY